MRESSAGGLAPEQAEKEAGRVVSQLEELCRIVERINSALAQSCALRLPAYSLLALVVKQGPQGITVSRAADCLDVRPQALAAPAAELAELGLITRLKDQTDGRARRLIATEAGLGRLDKTKDLRSKLLSEVKNQVPATNVAGLILNRLSLALDRALTQEQA